jgi:hypothetical protein
MVGSCGVLARTLQTMAVDISFATIYLIRPADRKLELIEVANISRGNFFSQFFLTYPSNRHHPRNSIPRCPNTTFRKTTNIRANFATSRLHRYATLAILVNLFFRRIAIF